MSRADQTISQALRRYLPRGAKLLVAVSGGRDSVCLLHACAALQKLFALSIEMAHVDHGLRVGSSRDARFVEKLAEQYCFPFHLKTASRPGRGVNLEAWGRKLRYDFFNEVILKRKLDLVLTAHTADDVAETFLMRLIANKELGSIDRFDPRRHCLRPFLNVTRSEIVSYIKRHRLQFVEDSTNNDTRLLRNRVRHRLLKILAEEFDPRIVEVLSIRAQAVLEDSGYLYELAEKAQKKIEPLEFGSKAWLKTVRGELNKLGAPLKWRLAEGLFREKLGYKLGRTKARSLVAFLQGEAVGLELPGAVSIRRKMGGIVLCRH